MGGYTYQDLFDTQEALDTGLLKQVQAGTQSWSKTGSGIFGTSLGASTAGGTRSIMAGAGDLGSILGQSDAIAAFKKRKVEQQKTAQQGFGIQQSILGGGAF
jgi:hypothetical protein